MQPSNISKTCTLATVSINRLRKLLEFGRRSNLKNEIAELISAIDQSTGKFDKSKVSHAIIQTLSDNAKQDLGLKCSLHIACDIEIDMEWPPEQKKIIKEFEKKSGFYNFLREDYSPEDIKYTKQDAIDITSSNPIHKSIHMDIAFLPLIYNKYSKIS